MINFCNDNKNDFDATIWSFDEGQKHIFQGIKKKNCHWFGKQNKVVLFFTENCLFAFKEVFFLFVVEKVRDLQTYFAKKY